VPCSSYTLIVLGLFLFFFAYFLLCFVHLTMVGPTDDNEHTPPQSPHMKGIIQALVREVKKHTEGIDADVHVTNERIGVLEATQLATDNKLETMEASIARIDNSLAALLRCFDDLMTQEHNRHQGHNNNNNYDEQVDDNWDGYSADSKLDDHDTRRPIQHNHHGRGGHRRQVISSRMTK
jgi:hypothetical protein